MSSSSSAEHSYSQMAARMAAGKSAAPIERQQPKRTMRKSSNVPVSWNAINHSTSSAAKAAAASSSYKANSQINKAIAPREGLPAPKIGANQQSRLLASFDLHKQDSRYRPDRILSPSQHISKSPNLEYQRDLKQQQNESSESLSSSIEKLDSSSSELLHHIPSQSQVKIKSTYKPVSQNQQPIYQQEQPQPSSRLNSFSSSQLQMENEEKLLSSNFNPYLAPTPSSTPNSNFYQLGQPVSSQQFLNFPKTLRKDKKSSFHIGKSKSKSNNQNGGDNFNEDKPWKHHETEAKLNVIDLTEKKRYDGLFVTNKGLYINRDLRFQQRPYKGTEYKVFVNKYSDPNERIHGLVVREIWKRSQLNLDTLARIWYLVLSIRKIKWLQLSSDRNLVNDLENESEPEPEDFDDGTLTREEFIVGMWIIDQCLYGRKLPKVISREVWHSVNSDVLINNKKWIKESDDIPIVDKKSNKKSYSSSGNGTRGSLFKKVIGKVQA